MNVTDHSLRQRLSLLACPRVTGVHAIRFIQLYRLLYSSLSSALYNSIVCFIQFYRLLYTTLSCCLIANHFFLFLTFIGSIYMVFMFYFFSFHLHKERYRQQKLLSSTSCVQIEVGSTLPFLLRGSIEQSSSLRIGFDSI